MFLWKNKILLDTTLAVNYSKLFFSIVINICFAFIFKKRYSGIILLGCSSIHLICSSCQEDLKKCLN